MKKKSIIIITFLFSIVLAMPEFTLEKTNDGYVINLNLPEIKQENIFPDVSMENGLWIYEHFTKVTIPGFASEGEYGAPVELVSSFYLAYEDMSPQIKVTNVVEEHFKLEHTLYPLQKPRAYCEHEYYFQYKPALYKKRNKRKPISHINEEFTYRGQKGVTITVNPTYYNSQNNILSVVRKMTLTITMNKPPRVQSYRSYNFDKIMRNIFVNLDKSVVSEPFAPEKYLVIAANSYIENEDLLRLINFRENSGLETELVSISDVGGSTKESFRTFITDKNPTYVVLVGSTTDFPYHTESRVKTFNYYVATNISGRPMPDKAMGLILVKDAIELKNVVNKTIATETNVETMPNVYVGHGGNTKQMGPLKPEHCDRLVEEIYNTYFKDLYYEHVPIYSVIEPLGDAPEDIAACNEGARFFNYNGHGNPNGWVYGWKSGDLSQLTNTVYPFVVSTCCNSGDWDRDGSFAVSFVAHEKGATAVTAAHSTSYHGMHVLNKGFFDAVITQNITKFGMAYLYGLNSDVAPQAVSAVNITTSQKTTMGWQYHCFGDPAVEMMRNPTSIQSLSNTKNIPSMCFSAAKGRQSIIFTRKQYGRGHLNIYTISGKLIFTHTMDEHAPTFIWNMKNNANKMISSGIYIATLSGKQGMNNNLVLVIP